MTDQSITDRHTVEMAARRPLPSFGLWLRQRRRAEGWEPEALAAAAGIGPDRIGQMEAGVIRPDKAVSERLADLLGLSPADRDVFVLLARVAEGRPLGGGPWDSGRVSSRAAGNLTAPTDPFLGRSVELGDLESWLTEGSTRLLTLLGPGGIGKTRLAQEAGLRAAAAFPDGLWFVDLAGLTDPAGIGPAVARTLELRDNGGADPDRAVWAALTGKRTLLILDNVEQIVAGAADWVAATRAAAPTAMLLVTSRVALQLGDEQILPVAPLDLPEAGTTTALAAQRSAAVALFVTRATAVQGQFRLTDANAGVVATICRRLDGMPLAIELAASRLTGTPAALLASLAQRLDLEAGGLTTADRPARHKTLRAVIDWSYHLLTAGEQALFRQLVVFGAGARLEAIEAVCGAADTTDLVFDSLLGLIGHSLVQMRVAADGGMRVEMLETIREYAAERPRPAGEWAALVAAHRAHYTQLVEWATLNFKARVDLPLWRGVLLDAIPNLSLVLERAFAVPATTGTGAALTAALLPFWEHSGYWQEGSRWGERARAVPALSDDLAARLALGLGTLYYNQSRREQALRLYNQALAHYAVGADRAGVAETRLRLGQVEVDEGHHEAAEPHLRAAVDGYAELGDTYNQGRALNSLGAVYYARGDYDMLIPYYEQALTLLTPHGDMHQISVALGNMGTAERFRGNLDRAEALLREALAIHRAIETNPGATARTISHLIGVLMDRGPVPEVPTLLAESLAIRRKIGDRRGILFCLIYQIEWAGRSGEPESARAAACEALHIALDIGTDAAANWAICPLLHLRTLLPREWGPRLLGALTGLGTVAITIQAPADRAAWDAIAATEQTLGPALYAAAFAEGQAAAAADILHALLVELESGSAPRD